MYQRHNILPGVGGSIPGMGGLISDVGTLIPDAAGNIPEFGGFLSTYFDSLMASSGGSASATDSGTADSITDLAAMPDLEFLMPILTSGGPNIGGGFVPMFGVNALDYYGTWKLFDALTDAAFYGKNREYALGNTPQQRFMGFWSDGKAIKELVVTDNP